MGTVLGAPQAMLQSWEWGSPRYRSGTAIGTSWAMAF